MLDTETVLDILADTVGWDWRIATHVTRDNAHLQRIIGGVFFITTNNQWTLLRKVGVQVGALKEEGLVFLDIDLRDALIAAGF